MTENAKTAGQIFDRYLPARLPSPRTASVYAPSNIALSKYWGKRDAELNLPLNSSLSISLGTWGTRTYIAPAQGTIDEVFFNGAVLGLDDPVVRRMLAFVDLFRRAQIIPLRIETTNSIPTAAGLASSASGFAALALAMNETFALDLPKSTLSQLARIGSGSAARSLWHGFVRWDRGDDGDGGDCYGHSLDVDWPDFRIAIISIHIGPKSSSSRDGMNHTVATSPLFDPWPAAAEADCAAIEHAIAEKDFVAVGERAEANALAMHATMMAARPSLSYLLPESWMVLQALWKARAEGLNCYATMDAGPNVKLIFLESQEDDVSRLFPQANVIAPFVDQA
ncbi:MAG: diphosphomevalonate decarboxylase [Pseudomonadota bacterium]